MGCLGDGEIGYTQRMVIKGFHSDWQPVISGVSQGSILGPTLSNIIINCLDDRIKSTLTKLVDDTKLGGVEDTSEGKDILQRDLNKL